MPQRPNKIAQFWQELKRRRVIHVITVYASASFVLIELVNNLTEPLNLPDKLATIIVVILAVGFPLAIILAWIYDLTPEGIEKTKAVQESEGAEQTKVPNAWRIATYVSFVVILGLLTLNIVGGSRGLRAGDIQSMVILPFDNFTGDDELEYFVSGMHASLINDMGQINGLRIISKTSASAYGDKDLTAKEIARELKVDAVVEASVLCLGDSLCMQFRLIDTKGDETQLWASDYREEKGQVLNLYNRITRKIAQEVKIELSPEEEGRLSKDRSVNPDAYDAFLKAQDHWEKLSFAGFDSALHYYQLAIDLDPDWAEPYGGMAMTLSVRGAFSMGLKESDQKGAFYYLDRALELDPDAAFLHYTKGIFAVWPGGQWKKGEKEFLRCLELNPSDALCRIYYAHLLMILHRFDEAREQADRALELDPLRPLVLGLYGEVMLVLGRHEAYLGDHEAALEDHETAVEQTRKALSIDSLNNFASGTYSGALMAIGDTSAWYEIFKEGLWYTTPAYLDSLDRIFQNEGYLGVIRERIRVFDEAYASGRHIPLNAHASRCMLVGDYDKAMKYYELAIQQGDGLISYTSLAYLQIPELMDYEPFLEMLRELNLPLPEN